MHLWLVWWPFAPFGLHRNEDKHKKAKWGDRSEDDDRWHQSSPTRLSGQRRRQRQKIVHQSATRGRCRAFRRLPARATKLLLCSEKPSWRQLTNHSSIRPVEIHSGVPGWCQVSFTASSSNNTSEELKLTRLLQTPRNIKGDECLGEEKCLFWISSEQQLGYIWF